MYILLSLIILSYLVRGYSTTHCSLPRPSPCPVYAGETWRRNKREERPRRDSQGTAERNFHHCKLRHGNLQRHLAGNGAGIC